MVHRALAATSALQSPPDLPMAWGPLFQRPRAIRVYLDDLAVETDSLDLDADQLLALRMREPPIELWAIIACHPS
jgi:hypothetical protein